MDDELGVGMSDFPYGLNGVEPGVPIEVSMERSLVAFLVGQFGQAGFFLENARILQGHRDARLVLGPNDLADAAPENARRVQVVIFGGEQREGFEGTEGSETVEISVEVSTHLRDGAEAMERHLKVVQGLRALLSRAWREDVKRELNAVADGDMKWQGIRRTSESVASTSFVGDVIFTRTTYEGIGWRVYAEE